jgi:hypothetical protein
LSQPTSILARILWRFYPAAWLTWAVGRLIHWACLILESEDDRLWLMADKANCAWFGGWLAVAEERLSELITYRAMGRIRRSFRGRMLAPHAPARAVTTLEEAYARFLRLIDRYHDAERLASLKAAKLKPLFDQAELQLEIVHHPLEAQPATTILCAAGARTILSAPGDEDSHCDRRIRGPPLGSASPTQNPAHPNPRGLLARTRHHARSDLAQPLDLSATTSTPASHTWRSRHPPPARAAPMLEIPRPRSSHGHGRRCR